MRSRSKKFLRNVGLAMATLVCMPCLVAPRVFADHYDRCQRRIATADHRLHEAIEREGWDSRSAAHWRHELHEARERCWNENHRWWDEDGRRWHSGRDWDDHDHDRAYPQ